MENGSDGSPDLSSLRQEIIESQKTRTDFLKYKLVVVAALGAVALGIGPAAGAKQVPYVIGIIPFVCLYVDAVCDHNTIRILIIGRFLRCTESPYRLYEEFAQSQRPRFRLEQVALYLSSLFISLGLLTFGVAYLIQIKGQKRDEVLMHIAIWPGALGVLLTVVLEVVHRKAMRKVRKDAEFLLAPGRNSP